MARRVKQTCPNSVFEHELRPLVEAAVSRRLILFAGGGVSQNLGLPDSRALVGHIAEQTGLAPERFGVSEYAVVAEAYQVREKQLGKLRSWMDREWHPESVRIEHPELHNLIVGLDFPIIYMTNYDRWLQRAFEEESVPQDHQCGGSDGGSRSAADYDREPRPR